MRPLLVIFCALVLLAPDQRTSDAWGHPYEIVCGPSDYVVRSAGPDGSRATETT